MYSHPHLKRLAERLVSLTFADTVFFCSSGTEAVEAAVKMMRRFHYKKGDTKRTRIISFDNSFHGRTYVGISAGGNASAREGFGPLLEGFDRATFNDIASVRNAITEETAGILLEPIQGEGGIREASADFLRELRALAYDKGVLLCLDEIQCGMGRTGNLLASEAAGIKPDLATIAKGIGNGFPLAACLVTERVGECMTPGSHGSTYGANPLAMAVGNAVLDVMMKPNFLTRVTDIGRVLKFQMEALQKLFKSQIEDVRGTGLMLGLKMKGDHHAFAAKLREAGLLTAPCAGDSVIRILPPLIIDNTHVEEAMSLLYQALEAQ
jgi:acetylornithine/N-succinyldiaminopimelate aminotransferase